jgi:glyoxylase-like metal-dependent hydrolase (beta-lactamase superfamily II)
MRRRESAGNSINRQFKINTDSSIQIRKRLMERIKNKESILLNRYIEGPLEVNTYLLADLDHPNKISAIIDPGGRGEDILDDIMKFDLKLKYIINTHGHIDHIAFNKFFKLQYGCEILIHEADAEWLNKKQDDFLFTLVAGEISPPPDRRFRDGEVLQIGGIELRVIHTPGHTPGSVCLQGDGYLFSGDTLFEGSIGRTDLPGGSYQDLMNSIHNRILTLDDDTAIYPGHGGHTTIGEEKESNPFLQL